MGCSNNENSTVVQLIMTDSISVVNDSLYFGRFTSINAIDNNIYTFDDTNGKIMVFDAENFNMIKLFGSKGVAPEEYDFVNSIIKINDNELWVAESGNYRIQKIDTNGNNIGIEKMQLIWKMQTLGNRIFYNNFAELPECSIFEYSNGISNPILKINEYFNKENIKHENRRYSYWISKDNIIVVSLFQNGRIVKFVNNEDVLEFQHAADNYYKIFYGGIKEFNNHFLVSGGILWDEPAPDADMDSIDLTEFFAEYDKEGKLLTRYDLPSDKKGIDVYTWDVWNNYVFFFNNLESTFYKAELNHKNTSHWLTLNFRKHVTLLI